MLYHIVVSTAYDKGETGVSMFVKKVTRRLTSTVKAFTGDCRFSVYLALLRVAHELGGRLHFKKLSVVAHEKKDRWLTAYLEKRLEGVLSRFEAYDSDGEYTEDAPIWVCWWSGEETAPDIVKQCLRSIKGKAGNHPVCVIDKDTVSQYLTIPDYMLDKVEKGQMGFAHLSDYIRVSLLAQYGGLWLDATIFCADNVPDICFELPFFTCKSEPQDCEYLSKMRWVTFVFGGWKGNVVYVYLKAAFEEYWSHEPAAIDYLFFDFLIDIGYRRIPHMRKVMDAVPINNIHRDDLQAAMNEALPAEAFDNVIKRDTVLYKLSWREIYSPRVSDGQKSIYTAFLEKEL